MSSRFISLTFVGILFSIFILWFQLLYVFLRPKDIKNEYKYIDNPVAYKYTILGYIERP